MSIESDSEPRGVHAATAAAASASSARNKCEAKRAEVQRLRERLDKVRAGEDDEDALLLAGQPLGTTDPLSCLCCCKLRRLGHCYILHERRVAAADGSMDTKLVIVGPHWIGVLVTLGIVLVSTSMFLSQHVAIMPWYDTLITFGLCSMTLYYLFQTTCTDPGIVRPQKETAQTEGESEVAELEAGQLPIPAEGVMEVQAAPLDEPRRRPSRRRFCDICGIEQDRSTGHCEDCGVCVAGYDHHCPWMGKCIGRGNMHAFKMFNVSWVVYVTFVLFVAITSVDWGHAVVQTLHRTASGAWALTDTPTQN
ncbi:Palmitoyltransferase ZDHHC14 [Phytophthora ramorum]|uniref:Palmitoyltransferase ZDHHC14 n=1 Tax=Phytophthora ramorum TaxID=164328 RepID=UPI003098CD83|nr:Palmitoyltransferase ZDHHC14 [Phytophthora ramorum]